jgi:predicted CoA-substrate-specific enzyme activase
MLFAGVDVGSRTAKAVILSDGEIAATHLTGTGPESARTAETVLAGALSKLGILTDELSYIVTTGYGRYIAPFTNESISEIYCHAKGVNWHFPSSRTILDMGGQDCKAIRVNERGEHTNFVMNDKCAAGTGRFLEVMADALGVPLEEIGGQSLNANGMIAISSACAVFARHEILAYRRKGSPLNDILAGLHEAVAHRVFGLIKKVGIEKDFVITGGIANNIGIVRRVEKLVGLESLIPSQPQLTGALGAAILAKENFLGQNQEKRG